MADFEEGFNETEDQGFNETEDPFFNALVVVHSSLTPGSPLNVQPNNFACTFVADNAPEVISSTSCIQNSTSSSTLPGEADDVPYFVYETPNGTRFWVSNVPQALKPIIRSNFSKWEDALDMYNAYAVEAGFSVRIGQQKKKNGFITHKYIRCNRASKPQHKREFNTLDESSLFVRQSSFKVTDCKAHILLQSESESPKCLLLNFNEFHNHPLAEKYNRDFTKIGRKLSFSSKQFIHKMSLNRIGPTISHRLLVAMKGGHHNVHGTPTNFKNFGQCVRLHIGDRDSTLLLERLHDRFKNYPEFYYDFTLVDGELRSVFGLMRYASSLTKRLVLC